MSRTRVKKRFVSNSSRVSDRTNSYRVESSSDRFDSTQLISSLRAITIEFRDVNGYPWVRIVWYPSSPHWINMIPVSAPYPRGYPLCGNLRVLRYPRVFVGTHGFFGINNIFFNYQKTWTFEYPYIIHSKFHKSYIIHRKFMILHNPYKFLK